MVANPSFGFSHLNNEILLVVVILRSKGKRNRQNRQKFGKNPLIVLGLPNCYRFFGNFW
jgi:hypothetical protein